MKILYLLFAFLFFAFLSEPGNAQPECHNRGGRCFGIWCPEDTVDVGGLDCRHGWTCCVPHKGK